MSSECSNFQECVSNVQFRNKSILDISSKLSEQTALLNRALVKSATYCGCISINAQKQIIDNNKSIDENRKCLKSHIEGRLCEKCKEKIEEEMGDVLYYLVSLCDALDLELDEVMKQKQKYIKTLGIYSLL
ncbi:DUF1573 domain-containing protein [Sedimentibacter sp. zth1]|uniref:MazG nucleotide pyrophosphohydrolase domain-containing protein n=1 Tax=Sedimentibacter sp. zth1 TaxID=2816908 RepID=UPI001A936732|nr:MazG nucleotide pyrophosphohydrolase domain-containing protein [Sedimentibacter sp. zth1]QSX07052.1 DUF1573 domain-containing protein [Sedimentibacter sp. zth1]